MEKLVLRGIMYGADKVPDSWFDRVPGGYYKAKPLPEQIKKQANMKARQSQLRKDGDGRHSDEYTRPSPRDYTPPRSRARRDSHRRRSFGDDDDDYDDEQEDRNASYVPRQYRGHDRKDRSGQPRPQRDNRSHRFDDSDATARSYAPKAGNDAVPPVNPATVAVAAAGMAAAQAADETKTSTPRQGPSDNYAGYVPYSNIYGSDAAASLPPQPFSPAPQSNAGSVQPTHLNQITTSRRNPHSPDPSLLNNALSPRKAYDDRYMPQDNNRYYDDRYYNEQYEPYDYEYEQTRFQRPTRPPMRRRSYDDSYDSRDGPRRDSSPRRPSNADSPSTISQKVQRARGKSVSRIKDTFTKSERGIGYGAVGALAGGLVGSELGDGAVPAAIGAVLGGLGANMFEARERSVNHANKNALSSRKSRDWDMLKCAHAMSSPFLYCMSKLYLSSLGSSLAHHLATSLTSCHRKKDSSRNTDLARDRDSNSRRRYRESERRTQDDHSSG